MFAETTRPFRCPGSERLLIPEMLCNGQRDCGGGGEDEECAALGGAAEEGGPDALRCVFLRWPRFECRAALCLDSEMVEGRTGRLVSQLLCRSLGFPTYRRFGWVDRAASNASAVAVGGIRCRGSALTASQCLFRPTRFSRSCPRLFALSCADSCHHSLTLPANSSTPTRLASPGFPALTHADLTCRWDIHAPALDLAIAIRFRTLNLHEPPALSNQSTPCTNSHILLGLGKEQTHSELNDDYMSSFRKAQLCHSDDVADRVFFSTGPSAFLQYYSGRFLGELRGDQGFLLEAWSVPCSETYCYADPHNTTIMEEVVVVSPLIAGVAISSSVISVLLLGAGACWFRQKWRRNRLLQLSFRQAHENRSAPNILHRMSFFAPPWRPGRERTDRDERRDAVWAHPEDFEFSVGEGSFGFSHLHSPPLPDAHPLVFRRGLGRLRAMPEQVYGLDDVEIDPAMGDDSVFRTPPPSSSSSPSQPLRSRSSSISHSYSEPGSLNGVAPPPSPLWSNLNMIPNPPLLNASDGSTPVLGRTQDDRSPPWSKHDSPRCVYEWEARRRGQGIQRDTDLLPQPWQLPCPRCQRKLGGPLPGSLECQHQRRMRRYLSHAVADKEAAEDAGRQELAEHLQVAQPLCDANHIPVAFLDVHSGELQLLSPATWKNPTKMRHVLQPHIFGAPPKPISDDIRPDGSDDGTYITLHPSSFRQIRSAWNAATASARRRPQVKHTAEELARTKSPVRSRNSFFALLSTARRRAAAAVTTTPFSRVSSLIHRITSFRSPSQHTPQPHTSTVRRSNTHLTPGFRSATPKTPAISRGTWKHWSPSKSVAKIWFWGTHFGGGAPIFRLGPKITRVSSYLQVHLGTPGFRPPPPGYALVTMPSRFL